MTGRIKNAFLRVERRTWAVFITAAIAALVLDQVTKIMIMGSLRPGENVGVIPDLFNLTLTFNKGAAFGFMSGVQDGLRQVLLSVTISMAMCVIGYFLLFEYYNDKFACFALGIIIGGAFGNIVDRFRIGMVVDFLDVYFREYHWPAFNLADSFICIGVFILLFRRRSPAGEPS